MKVYIGKYRDNWLSPYTILDYVFFWTDWSRCSRKWTLADTLADDQLPRSRYRERPEWTERWAERLMPLCEALHWIRRRVTPRIEYVKIDRWDTWSMDHTLAMIVLPMLRQLKDTKHGAPLVEDADVPEHLQSTQAPPKQEEYDVDGNHFARWDWVLEEIIWAFEQTLDDNSDSQFYSGELDHVWVPVDADGNQVPRGEHKYFRMDDGPNHTFKVDREGLKAWHDRRQRAFVLFGKYYQSLWD
jgi:hypothetical protein